MPSKQENLEAVKLWNEAKVPKSAQAKRYLEGPVSATSGHSDVLSYRTRLRPMVAEASPDTAIIFARYRVSRT